MDNTYRTGYRTDRILRNHPLVDALYYYLELVGSIKTARCFSGMRKLYLIQSGGLDMGGVTDNSPFTTQSPWALTPASTLRDAIAETPYVGLAILSNLRSYIDVMGALIKHKITFNKNESIRTTGEELPYSSPVFSALYSFNPSPLILGAMRDTMRRCSAFVPGNLNAYEKISAMDQLRGIVDAELDRLVANGGLGSDNSPDLGTTIEFVDFCSRLLDEAALSTTPTIGNTSGMALTIARIFLTITRLLHGQVAPITQDENIRAGTTYSDRLRISDETLAALPTPNRVLISEFEEPEVPIISRYGALYLASLERAYSS